MKAFTLTELLIAIIILVAAVAGIMGTSVFFLFQVKAQMERADCQAQLSLAFEDMKLHFMSAASVDTTLRASGQTVSSFIVFGEKDVYKITPNITTDNVDYTYMLRSPCYAGKTGACLIRRTGTGAAAQDEILVDARFDPKAEFIYTAGDPPNFLTVRITAHTATTPLGLTNEVVRQEGIRFWFVDVAK